MRAKNTYIYIYEISIYVNVVNEKSMYAITATKIFNCFNKQPN